MLQQTKRKSKHMPPIQKNPEQKQSVSQWELWNPGEPGKYTPSSTVTKLPT